MTTDKTSRVPRRAPTTDETREDGAQNSGALAQGVAVLVKAVKTLPNRPGVYRMLDHKGDALYVGKAKSLKKRVTSYCQPAKLPRRLQRMIASTAALEVVTTHTELEALLLESNLIKRLMPRYNVLLRDDKSFPYIVITGGTDYPQVAKHRGGGAAGPLARRREKTGPRQ